MKDTRHAIHSLVFWSGVAIALIPSLLDLYFTFTLLAGVGSWKDGARWILHNPGSCLFHLALFPTAFGLTVFLFGELVRSCRGAVRIAVIAVAAALLAVVTADVFDLDVEQSTTERVVEPSNIGDEDDRGAILATDRRLRWKDELEPAQMREQYEAVVASRLGTEGFDLSEQGSVCAHLGRILSGLGALGGFFLLASLVGLAVVGEARKLQLEILASICIFAMWVPLRIYSEWYASFGDFRLEEYQALIVASFFIALSGIVLTVITTNDQVVRIAGLAVNVGSLGFAVFAKVKPESMGPVFDALDSRSVLAIEVGLAIGVLCSVASILRSKTGSTGDSPPVE